MTQVVLHRYNTIILENTEVRKCDIFHIAFFKQKCYLKSVFLVTFRIYCILITVDN